MGKWYVLLLLWFFSHCQSHRPGHGVSVVWEGGDPVGLNMPNDLFPDNFKTDEIRIYVAEYQSNRSVLGSFHQTDSSVVFRTLIPLTYEVTYRITYKHLVVKETRIFQPVVRDMPQLLYVYPTTDTLPENLLKFYFLFSHAMGQDHSLRHIFLIDEKGDSLQPFLNLSNELWNNDRTLLNLWMDPGRIKRDLVPNKVLGNPLRESQTYRLVVSDRWRDDRGYTLKNAYEKPFFVSGRDDTKPNPKYWTISPPPAGSRQYLRIAFHEPLDYGLIKECFAIWNDKEQFIEGNWMPDENETGIAFIPSSSWEKGNYQVRIQEKLEDLAGNNLKRLFDQDLERQSSPNQPPRLTIDFTIAE